MHAFAQHLYRKLLDIETLYRKYEKYQNNDIEMGKFSKNHTINLVVTIFYKLFIIYICKNSKVHKVN